MEGVVENKDIHVQYAFKLKKKNLEKSLQYMYVVAKRVQLLAQYTLYLCTLLHSTCTCSIPDTLPVKCCSNVILHPQYPDMCTLYLEAGVHTLITVLSHLSVSYLVPPTPLV
jgi:hypothetical protein